MPDYLLSDAQLAAVQEVALRGMKTQVKIYRKTTADSDYGDEETITFPLHLTVMGWMFSRPIAQQEQDTGSLVAANTYRLFLPVGTDILVGDKVAIGAQEYIVSDTTAETTWPALLTCSLRKRE